MSNTKSVDTLVDQLNRAMPILNDVKAGTLLKEVIDGFNLLLTRLKTGVLSSPGLTIKAGGSAVVKAGNAFAAVINGVAVNKAANTDMAALAGTLATAKSAAWAFYVNASGTLSVSAKTADADDHAAAISLLPVTPDDKALVGFVVIDNATGSDFVGGTTALDTASLTVTYYNGDGLIGFSAAMGVNDLAALNAR